MLLSNFEFWKQGFDFILRFFWFLNAKYNCKKKCSSNFKRSIALFKSINDFAKWISLSALFNSIKFVSSKKFFSKWSLIEIEDFFIVFIILLKNLLSIPLFFKLDVRG